MGFRFIHTADLQIGKGFGNFPDDVAAKLQDERLGVVKRVAKLANERRVDAILVAGDCFDKISVSDNTLRRFKVAMEGYGGKWVLLPGNHDYAAAESPWSRIKRLGLPSNVIVADEPKVLLINDRVVILPAPLRRRQEVSDLTEWFDASDTEKNIIRIGLAHGSVERVLPASHCVSNPIAYDRCEKAKLDYLALGDWHGHKKISERAWYAGTPEPDRFPVNKPGYVLDVMIEQAGAVPQVEPVFVARYCWQIHSINVLPSEPYELNKISEISNLDSMILKLELNGTVDLVTHTMVEEICNELSARVTHLELDRGKLLIEPDDRDFDGLDVSGFVRVAIDRLGKMNSEKSKRALVLLHGLVSLDKGGDVNVPAQN